MFEIYNSDFYLVEFGVLQNHTPGRSMKNVKFGIMVK